MYELQRTGLRYHCIIVGTIAAAPSFVQRLGGGGGGWGVDKVGAKNTTLF